MERFVGYCVLGFFLVMALVMYWLNYTAGTLAFLFLGLSFEILFWLGVFDESEQENVIKD